MSTKTECTGLTKMPSSTSLAGSDTTDESVAMSTSIIDAQKSAEEEVDRLEAEKIPGEEEALPAIPRLLQLPEQALKNKAQELQKKGEQLDLLLLKAESYSHFIQENQKMSVMSMNEDAKKSTGSASKGKRKRADDGSEQAFKQPENLVGGTLLPYQLDGLQWLASLWENGLSGILADEMGLGKTIQVISLVAYLRMRNTSGPFMIAGPLAVIPNWINEFKKWLPSCPVIMYHGTKDERAAMRRSRMPISKQKDMDFPVIITSFEILMIDRAFLERYVWQYIILDEGHRIKNRNCRLVRELKSIKSISRLLLTGTPIQNTLEELWSLLNFCSPAIFDDLRVFQAWFGFKNIGKDTTVDDILGDEQQERVVTKLHEILRPFLLRRMKQDVLLKLPPKKEIVVYCAMTSLQREYYARVLNGTIRDSLVAMNIEGAKEVSQQNTFMNLRKVCNHPFLFGEPKDETGRYLGVVNPSLLGMASGKFKLLTRMLPQLQQKGHKVLIFSQMTELLNILEDFLLNLGYKYCRLDGTTKVKDRQERIDAFNKDKNIFCFLLSTRAGGLGINLTAADTCILFDSDWNPHQDSQAQDRCHRIGQQKPVLVYRLLTAGSCEIEMMEKQISKKKLERLTIHGGDYRKAGQRAGANLTLGKLRKLLEDDVKNLTRFADTRKSDSVLDCTVPDDGEEVSKNTAVGDARSLSKGTLYNDMSEEELQLVMDRERLFPLFDAMDLTGAKDAAAEAADMQVDKADAVTKKKAKSPAKAKTPVKRGAKEEKPEGDIPLEGIMYDIVIVEKSAGVLGGLNG